MKAAFDSQEVARLQAVAESMDREVFSYHLQRCIDSGLWIPDASAQKGTAGNSDNVNFKLLLAQFRLAMGK